jgi:hypothetical protein
MMTETFHCTSISPDRLGSADDSTSGEYSIFHRQDLLHVCACCGYVQHCSSYHDMYSLCQSDRHNSSTGTCLP